MKFSFPLIKQFIPALKSKGELIEALTMHAFEAEDAGGDVLEVKLLNRSSDAASHWGVAREAAAALRTRHTVPDIKESYPLVPRRGETKPHYSVQVDAPALCSRYTAQYFEDVRIGPSPQWFTRILEDCGLRSVNNVVDVMNYVMLEVGQPLHAFDYDKIAGKKIIVRKAKRGEQIVSLDGVPYKLNNDVLVIADAEKPLALAGIKGGVAAAVSGKTERILVEAATFDPVNVYRTSKALSLSTDASLRFSHNLHPAFAAVGLGRAAELLTEVAHARAGVVFDSLTKPLLPRKVMFDEKKFESLIGTSVKKEEAQELLECLGFVVEKEGSATSFLVEVPLVRQDIEDGADLAEEVMRLRGYEKLPAMPPAVFLAPAREEEMILTKSKTRSMLAGLGFDEVLNRSLVSEADLERIGAKSAVELENPVSSEFQYLRPLLAPHLMRNAEQNERFFDEFSIFEIGRVFQRERQGVLERTMVGMFSADKHKESFFTLKGAVERFIRGMGIVDYAFVPGSGLFRSTAFPTKHIEKGTLLRLVSGKEEFGFLGKISGERGLHRALAELDLDALASLAEGEREYEPLERYPAVMRDISVLVEIDVTIGEVIEAVQRVSTTLIQDVDLIDEYVGRDWKNEQSITMRIVFQAKDRTLTSEEVDTLIDKITSMLESRFRGQIR